MCETMYMYVYYGMVWPGQIIQLLEAEYSMRETLQDFLFAFLGVILQIKSKNVSHNVIVILLINNNIAITVRII